ncbi:molybdenum cofactor guanylyltransferase [Paenibacillus alkalitolerans]|uniref:molybdenum cofactor guanylyltransferase n=1 Tax=Paenibacillus alkalitolerans TaxID=2799335 RepID=UPI0018F44C1C|nr:molybdenum cofactor guanylyltransferase [Paenibacillus alkalitolerans]
MELGAIILAGGKSSRMGEDKWLLRFGGQTVLERIVDTVLPYADSLSIVLEYVEGEDRSNKLPASIAANQSICVIRDEMPEIGPLAGIYAGLRSSQTEYNLVIAGDMPFPSWPLAQRLLTECRQRGAMCALPELDGRWHPMFAVYRSSAADGLAQYIRQGGRKVTDWMRTLAPAVIGEHTVQQIDPAGIALFNMNTPSDYDTALRLFSSEKK